MLDRGLNAADLLQGISGSPSGHYRQGNSAPAIAPTRYQLSPRKTIAIRGLQPCERLPGKHEILFMR
jgi:hypothetical protein